MPIYEYACRDCGEHVEVVQSFKDEPLTTCGICRGELRKVFSAAGIIFKGDGYYVTDTRKQQKKAAGRKGGKATARKRS
jgi:putative FmdB family regulatory protein